mmetsp:Transcript_15372/g.27443  ORF Transcript_15372/g.27443 Transcript_15372/m.27443 type:complete len:373 (+) Transcript_15372:158-1276(+)
MESAMRSVIKTMFEEYAYNLDKSLDASGFPITLRNLRLKEKRVNEDLEDTPFELSKGTIGSVSLTAGWMGELTVAASNIKLDLSFNPAKAAKLLMSKGQEVPDDDIFLTGQHAPPQPPPNVPPRFCFNHDTSEKRPKREPYVQTCMICGMSMQTSYCDVQLCPPCSEKEKKCMICGKQAGRAGTYMPPAELGGKPLMGSPDRDQGPRGGPPGAPPPGVDAQSQPQGMQGMNQQFPRDPTNGTLPPSASNYGIGLPTSTSNYGPGGPPGGPPGSYPGGPPGSYDDTRLTTSRPQGAPPPPRRGPPGARPPGARPRRPPTEDDDDDSFMGFLKWLIPTGGDCGHGPDPMERANYEVQVQQRPPGPPMPPPNARR